MNSTGQTLNIGSDELILEALRLDDDARLTGALWADWFCSKKVRAWFQKGAFSTNFIQKYYH